MRSIFNVNGQNAAVLLVGVGAATAVGAVSLVVLRRCAHRRYSPTVFISYRRSLSAGYAQSVGKGIEERGATVLLDVEDIHAGDFPEQIQTNILKSDCVIVILAPETLQSEWVVREIRFAHAQRKVIIPVLTNGFNLDGGEVTPELAFLQTQNAVMLIPQYHRAAVDKIAEFIGLKDE